MTAKVIPLEPRRVRSGELSDEALVAGCAVDDDRCLAELYRRHQSAVRRFLGRFLGANAPEIDDIAQQTFLTAWQNADRFRSESRVSSWLIGIAANLARAHTRKERRRVDLFNIFAVRNPEGPILSDELISKKQLVERLRVAVGELPHHLRVAYVMCEIEEIPGTEAARALGVRPGTMWRRLHDARRRLRAALAEELS